MCNILIKGRGGHGARPQESIDPILTATRIINSLYLLPSRRFSALDPVVINICQISGGNNHNVVPDQVVMKGTCRYFSKAVGDQLPSLVDHVIRTECQNTGADYELEYQRPYIPTINNEAAVHRGKELVKPKSCNPEMRWTNISRM